MCHSCQNLVRNVSNSSIIATLALALTDIRHLSYIISHISSVFTPSDNKNRPTVICYSINREVVLKFSKYNHCSTVSWGEEHVCKRNNRTV